MSRRRRDPVDAAFDLWADLTPEQKKQFHWSMEGYNMARKEAIRDNGGVEPDRVQPRERKRRAKPNGQDVHGPEPSISLDETIKEQIRRGQL